MRISWRVVVMAAAVATIAGCAGGAGVSGTPVGPAGSSVTSAAGDSGSAASAAPDGADSAPGATTPSTVSEPVASTGSAVSVQPSFSGQAWFLPRDGGQSRKLDLPPLSQLVGGHPYLAGLTATGDVWTIDPDKGTVTKLALSGVRQLSDHQDTGNPDPWYGLLADGRVVQGTGDAAHPFVHVTLPFADISEIAASDGLWVLRSDGSVWHVDIDFHTVDGSGKPVPTGYQGDSYDVPEEVDPAPVQGLVDVAHLWNGVGTHPPIAETKDGALLTLERSDANDRPVALPVRAPGVRVVQLRDVGVTWVALDESGNLWYWPSGIEDDTDSDRDEMLIDNPPERLVGPGKMANVPVAYGGLIFSPDGTIWRLSASESGPVVVTDATDGVTVGDSTISVSAPQGANSAVRYATRTVYVLG